MLPWGQLISLSLLYFPRLDALLGTVSYAKELTSISIYYSQRNCFSTPLSRLLQYCKSDVYVVYRSEETVLCSVVRFCPTSGDVSKDFVFVCTPR